MIRYEHVKEEFPWKTAHTTTSYREITTPGEMLIPLGLVNG